MLEKSYITLELPAVLEMLAAQAESELGKAAARELQPSANTEEVCSTELICISYSLTYTIYKHLIRFIAIITSPYSYCLRSIIYIISYSYALIFLWKNITNRDC